MNSLTSSLPEAAVSFFRLRGAVLLVLSLLLIIVLLIAASAGAVSMPPLSVLTGSLSDQQQAVLTLIRLPRVLLAAIVGAALAVSGAAMQGLFRNPLADPGVIGIASGAALAVAIMIVFSGPLTGATGLFGLSFAAFIGGMITFMIIFRLSRISGAVSVVYILLAGIAINTLAGAGTGFITYLSNDQQLRSLTFWTMGSFGGTLWPAVLVAATIIIPAVVLMMFSARGLNILVLGEDQAHYLGIDCKRLHWQIILCTALSVGAAVAVSGIIGFVGLVVPHLIRLSIGPDHRLLLPASALLGALLLVIADTIARIIVSPAELPVGIITSFVGGPFFLWLLVKQFAGRYGI